MLQQRNRKTHGIIQLHKRTEGYGMGAAYQQDWYWATCEHGSKSGESRHKSYVVEWMAHPWHWCKKCNAILLTRVAADRSTGG
jgi:hypothetical protein